MREPIPLGQVVRIRKGKKAPKVFEQPTNGALPYLQIDQVRGIAPIKFAEDSKGVEVTPEDLCIVWDGANAGVIGYGISGLIGSTVARMRLLSPSEWETRFIGRLLESKFQELNDQAHARGATIPHVDKSKLEQISLPKLTPEEQHRIAGILDKADAIRHKRERIVTLANDFLQSVYVHTIGHLNPEYHSWKPHFIDQLADDRKNSIRSGPFGSALRHGEFVDDGVAVLGIDNAIKNRFSWGRRRYITEEKYERLRRYRVFPDDVIITIMGTTGRAAVVPRDIPKAITSKHLATITCDKKVVLPDVLAFAIHSDPMITRQIEAFNKGAIMDGLNLGIIRQLELRRPPMEGQERFVRIYNKINRMLNIFDCSIGYKSDLLRSLSQRAFRGEL